MIRLCISLGIVLLIPCSAAASDSNLVVHQDMTLAAGTYTYKTITVHPEATLFLGGNAAASTSFQGVHIIAERIIVAQGGRIAADGSGYGVQQGPGAPEHYRHGGSHGGVGRGNVGTSTYGSSIHPTQLGSGGGNGAGGGAIQLEVSESLQIDGVLSANGNPTGSGGSIAITTNTLSGAGTISAEGGQYAVTASAIQAGGGGRIFISSHTNTYTGNISVRGGKNYQSATYAQSGTLALYDINTDTITVNDRWQLDGAYGPFTYTSIIVEDGVLAIENNADVTVGTLAIHDAAEVSVSKDVHLSATQLIITDTAQLAYGSEAPLTIEDTLRIEDEATLHGNTQTRLHIDAANIIIGDDAHVHVDKMGYGQDGLGTPTAGTRAGASHGGAAYGPHTQSVYGSLEEPIDFGSAGDFQELGGGALYMTASDTLRHNGTISANGGRAASGGSIWIDTHTLHGTGVIQADGGDYGRNTHYIGAGAGGRIALYTKNTEQWTGTTTAKGGTLVASAGAPTRYAGNGTVYARAADPEPEIDPLLLQYAPVLYMHPDETYFPMNVESFVQDSALWDQSGFDTQLRNAEELTFEEFESIIEGGADTSDYYLAYSDPNEKKSINLDNARTTYRNAVEAGEATTTIYVHRMNDSYTDSRGKEHEFIVLQYWFFYAMNNWREEGGFNNHEGDWESIFVFLDASSEDPEYVAYSAHLNDGDSSDHAFQYGSVRREWDSDEVSFIYGNIASYVSLGSHAKYPNNGNDGIHKVSKGNDDETSANGLTINVDLNMKNIVSSTTPVWMRYEGKWGSDGTSIVGGDNGPQGPSHIKLLGHKRFARPVEWAGVDQIEVVEISEPFESVRVSDVQFDFNQLTPPETTLAVSPHYEMVTFGTFPEEVAPMPVFWDIESSLKNDTFEVAMTMPYSKTTLEQMEATPDELVGLYFDPGAVEWGIVPSTVDADTGTITILTSHFSRYGIGVLKKEPTVEELYDELRTQINALTLPKSHTRIMLKAVKLSEKFYKKDRVRIANRLLRIVLKKSKHLERRGKITEDEYNDIRDIIQQIRDARE